MTGSAKQTMAHRKEMDCFAALAMTGEAMAGKRRKPSFPDVQLHIPSAKRPDYFVRASSTTTVLAEKPGLG